MTSPPHIRQARVSDYDAVASFTRDTWPERAMADYIPRVFEEWIDTDGADQQTFVVDVRDDPFPPAEPGDVAALAQGHRLTPWEAWASGMRVAPAHRGRGLSNALTSAIFEWARERGCVVCRNMTFSWNAPALGSARRVGFDPCTEIRWAQPTPEGEQHESVDATPHPDGAWAFWSDSAARGHLRGLVMDDDQSWALSTLTRTRLHRAADEGRLVTVDRGRSGFTERIRTFERDEERDGESETVEYAEYSIGAWPEGDATAASAVLAGVACDAASLGVDRTRVMIPEGVTWASDASAARSAIADEPAFVLAARL